MGCGFGYSYFRSLNRNFDFPSLLYLSPGVICDPLFSLDEYLAQIILAGDEVDVLDGGPIIFNAATFGNVRSTALHFFQAKKG